MCRRIRCEDCQKPTFAGCGKHIETVLKDVPVDARCSCPATVARTPSAPVVQAQVSSTSVSAYASAPAKQSSQSTTSAQVSAYASAAVYASAPCRVDSKPRVSETSAPVQQVYASAPQKRSASAPHSTPAPAANTSQQSPFSSPFSSRPPARRVA